MHSEIVDFSNQDKEDYKYWVIKIIDSVENKKQLDKESYDKLINNYPEVKKIIDELIHNVEIFSIYDNEPSTINFDYEAYLLQIKQIVEKE